MLHLTGTRVHTDPKFGWEEMQFRINDDAWMNAKLCGESAAHQATVDPSTHSHWAWFIAWLIDEQSFNGQEIRQVIEKPCKHRDLFIEYVLTEALAECRDTMFNRLFV